MTLDETIKALVDNDGAILYWQLPKDAVQAAIRSGLAYLADDDCLVHRDAVRIAEGAYTMESDRNSDSGGRA
jgi:hypothetical protein